MVATLAKRQLDSMIDPPADHLPRLLSSIASVLVIISSSSGLIIGPSLYQPMTPDELLPGSLSQDTVSLLVGITVFILSVRRKRLQLDSLVWLGLLGYLIYAYSLYSFEGVYNPLFLCYVAILGLTVWSVILFFWHAHLDRVRADKKAPPRRITACFLLALVLLFLLLWLSIIVPAMFSRVPPDGNAIFVQDLAFVLPLLAATARLLWKADPLGDVLAVPILVKAGLVGISVFLGAVYGPVFFATSEPLNPADLFIYGLLGFGPLMLVPSFLRTFSYRLEKSD